MECEDRIGKNGEYAKLGDIVEIVGGKKFPIGMKVPVAGFWAWEKYVSGSFVAYGEHHIEFYDEGFKVARIPSKYVRIVAEVEDRLDNPEYKNVHDVVVYA